jgi:trans-aconitate methyltransferase
MSDRRPSAFEDVYFAMLVEMGFTNHLGGQQATDELVELCHIGAHSYVLDVGCGVGITPCQMARVYGCRVMGVELRGAMVERARQRAAREGVGDLAEFVRVARQGGYVGISESTWIKEHTLELRAEVARSLGGNLDVRSPEEWQAPLEAGGLRDVVEDQRDHPWEKEVISFWGYGLYVGQR